MKPERRYIDFMQDIVDNLKKAESFVEEMDFEEFSMMRDALLHNPCAFSIPAEKS